MKKILIINGPNLNLLGTRERDVYGSMTFEEYLAGLREEFSDRVQFDYFQSNVEGELIDRLHRAAQLVEGEKSVEKQDGVILNAGGYTHTSVALADAVGAVRALGLETVEVHISNILAREEFRHISLIAPRCKGSIMGFGMASYKLATLSFI
jgi:3-dehydroquinate dehydratase-2